MNKQNVKRLTVLSFLTVALMTGLVSVATLNQESIASYAWSGKQTSDAPATYYAGCESLSGTALQNKLFEIGDPSKASRSYDWSRYEACDEIENDSNSIISIYTRHAIKKSNHCGNYAWDKWNREHIWTQAAYPESKTDNHNIFACEGQINGYRGNLPFADLGKKGTEQVVFGHNTGCYISGGYFEPCDEAKGEVARSVMYGTVMYKRTMTSIIKSIETALQWNLDFPVSNRDIFRNNTVYKQQNNRNPFVDHPEYACRIWGNISATAKAICSSEPKVDVTSVSLDETSISINVDETKTLVATVLPENATDKSVTWSSSNPSVASISDGKVKGLKAGSTVITVKTNDGNKTATCDVTVNEKPVVHVDSVSLNKNSLALSINDTASLVATVLPENAFDKSVTWESGDKTIATVDNKGLVKAVKAGNTTVTVKTNDGNKTATCNVIVTENPIIHVTSVKINESILELKVNSTSQLSVTVGPENATDKSVTWSSTDTSIATVDNNGLVKALKAGKVNISATANDGGISVKCELTVIEAKKGGCGGNILTSSFIISAIALAGVSLILLRKLLVKKEK